MALLGNFPNPGSVGGVDYRVILQFVSSAMRGHVFKEPINNSTAAKLYSLLSALETKFCHRDDVPTPESFEIPEKNPPPGPKERNEILARRRSIHWSVEELAARQDVLSPDLATVRRRYLSIPCFNPFKFPPE